MGSDSSSGSGNQNGPLCVRHGSTVYDGGEGFRLGSVVDAEATDASNDLIGGPCNPGLFV
jgi:hypothetical protein